MARLRRRGSRHRVVGLAVVGAATAQAVVRAGDHLTDRLNVLDLGAIILSVAGRR